MPSDYVTHRDADACRHRSVIGTMNAQHLANVCRYGLYEHTQYSVGMRGQTTQRSEFGRNTYDARLSFISGKWTFNAGVSTRSGCITGFHPRYQRSNESLIMRRPLFRSGTAGRFWIMAGLKGWSFFFTAHASAPKPFEQLILDDRHSIPPDILSGDHNRFSPNIVVRCDPFFIGIRQSWLTVSM